MSTTELSVVIPTYNRRDLLKDLLLSLSSQTLPIDKFEVVVVVDGSTDGTLEMLAELETPFSLRSVYQKNAGLGSAIHSTGVSAARNRGVQHAQGPLVVFLDDDVAPSPSLLNEHANVHREDPNAVVLGRLLPSVNGFVPRM